MLTQLLKKGVKIARRTLRRKSPLSYTPTIESNQFLFIGGLHRSGTSVFHRLLKEHPSTSGFSTTGAPEDEGQHLQSVFPPAAAFGGPGRFAFDPRSHLRETPQNPCSPDRDTLLREWGVYYDLTKAIFLEKSPPNLIRSRFLQGLFPEARFVFIVRHPIAVALATQKWSKTSVTELILHWYIAHRILLKDLRVIRKYAVVRYEDFVHSPQKHLNKVCDLFGLDRFTPQEIVFDHNRKYFEKWEDHHSEEQKLIDQMVSHNQSPLTIFGYSLSEPYVGSYTTAVSGDNQAPK
jgi:hypothetical protein